MATSTKKAIVIVIIAAIVAIAALMLTSGVASATKHVVNQTDPACDDGDYYYTSIQAAVWNASSGDTIIVCPGRYNETVTVNKSNIVITAFNETKPIVSAVNNPDDHVFSITDQTNFTLAGFEIRDANGTTQNVAGIYMYNATECNISNTIVTNISATNYRAYGIYLFKSSDNRFSSSTSVSTITSTNNNAYGILLDISSNNNRFSASTSVSNITATNGKAYGIYLYSSSNNIFSSSTSVSTITATNFNAYGILLEVDSDDNNFTGVTIRPNITGVEYYEFYSATGCDDNVVTDLTIGNPTTISFTYGNGIWIKRVEAAERPGDPANFRNISKYINASNLTVNSWLFVNFGYNESDVADVDENTLSVWKHNGTAWNKEGWNGSRVLDTTNNVVGVNITSFCIFAPLGNPTSVTIPTATGTGNATITTSSGYFCDATALNDSYFPSVPDSALTFFHGFFNFTICGLNTTNPETITINFTFPSAIPTDAEFWKYNASNGTWYRYEFGDNDGDNVISITITDNGAGDHNPANGTINDPNGIGSPIPAQVPEFTPISLIALISVLSVIVALTITEGKRR